MYRSVGSTALRYLLYATVALLVLEGFVDVGSHISLGWLSLVVAGALSIAVLTRPFASSTAFERPDPESAAPQPSSRTVAVILLGLCVAGGILRVYALDAQSFWFDEAISTNAAIAVLESGRPTFPSGYTYWRAFPHTLVMAGSMAIFGTGEAAARAPSVLFGVVTIAATYWLGREVGGPRVGLLAAVLVTFATWEIAWSRQARMYQLFQLLYVLALVLLLRVERTWLEDWRAILLLVLVVVLAALTHQIGYVLFPVAVAYLGLVGLVDRRLSGRIAVGFLAGSLLLVLAVEFVTAGFSGALESVLATDVSYWENYSEWLRGEFHSFVLLGIVGAALTFYRGWYRAGTLLVLAVAPAAWILSFHTELFASRYLYFLVPIVFVWAAIVIDYVAILATGRMRTIGGYIGGFESRVSRADGRTVSACVACVAAFAFVVLLALGGGFTVVPQAEYELGTNAPQPEFAGVYEYVNEHREEGDVIVAGWTAPGMYYAGGVDYWLTHDLTGTGTDWTTNSGELYADAEPIETTTELEAVMDDHERGWIIADEITLVRQDQELRSKLEKMPSRQFDSIHVYYWDHED